MNPAVFDPFIERENYRRLSRRYKLSFEFDGHSILPMEGWRSEAREATDEERELWQALMVGHDMMNLHATSKEMAFSLRNQSGAVTLNARDLAILCKMGSGHFRTETQRVRLKEGCFGYYHNLQEQWCPVYVSRVIPVGFFYLGAPEPWMHFVPPEGTERVLAPVPSKEDQARMQRGLQPFLQDG